MDVFKVSIALWGRKPKHSCNTAMYKALYEAGIVVDIQGVGYQLTDPEIACREEFIKE